MTVVSRRILLVGLLLSACVVAGPGSVGRAGSIDDRLHVEEHTGEAVLDQEFKLEYGQEVAVKGQELSVKFDAVLEDSRCPTGVNCVWEGDAKILIGAREATSEALKLELHTNGRFNQAGAYRQYVIRLVALDPHPKADVENEQKDYVATLLITRQS
jgi:hypothetical protein